MQMRLRISVPMFQSRVRFSIWLVKEAIFKYWWISLIENWKWKPDQRRTKLLLNMYLLLPRLDFCWSCVNFFMPKITFLNFTSFYQRSPISKINVPTILVFYKLCSYTNYLLYKKPLRPTLKMRLFYFY